MKRTVLLLVLVFFCVPLFPTIGDAQTIRARLDDAESDLFAGRVFKVSFPDTKTRRELRDDYLGLRADGTPDPTGTPKYPFLKSAYDQALDIRTVYAHEATPSELYEAKLVAYEALESLLEGQMIIGNFKLLNGLRVAYPDAGGTEMPEGEAQMPIGCPCNASGTDYYGVNLLDLCYAREHFFRGVTSALEFLAVDSEGELRSIDKINTPSFEQYTVFDKDIDDPNFGGDVDIQTTGYLLGNTLDRYGKAIVGMGDRLWRGAYFDRERGPLGIRAAERSKMLTEAMQELQRGIHAQFLAALPLAATMSDEEYQLCRIVQLRVSAATASSFIDRIRRGEIPKLDTMNLNASVVDINNQLSLIGTLKTTAMNKYGDAEEAIWNSRNSEAEMISEAQQLRFQFSDQLLSTTFINPDVDPYFGLTNDYQRILYKQKVYEKIQQMHDEGLNSPYITEGSELSQVLLQMFRAFADVDSARMRIESIPHQIRIEEERVGAINGVILGTQDQISAYQLAIGIANSMTVSTTDSFGFQCSFSPPMPGCGISMSASTTTNYNPGAITSAVFQNKIGRAQAIQQVTINEYDSEARIRNLLLEMDQRQTDFEGAAIQAQLAIANFNSLVARIDRLIENHIYYQDSNAEKWWHDPALMFEQEKAEMDSDEALREYVRELYNLAQMLAARWSEPYENPFLKVDGTPQTLGGGLYDDFTQIESIFNVNKYDQADGFYTALKAWDNTLRSHRTGGQSNVTNVISLRKDIYGFSEIVWNDAMSWYEIDPTLVPEKHNWFRALLLRNKLAGTSPYWLRLDFPLTYRQRSQSAEGIQIPAVITSFRTDWNIRMTKISAKLIGNNIAQAANNKYRLQIFQYGKLEFPTYHPRQTDVYPNFRTIQLPLYYTDPEVASTSPYMFDVQAGINGFSGDENTDIELFEPTPFCDRYVLLIPRQDQPNLNIHNIEDIEFTVTWRSGIPPVFAWPAKTMEEEEVPLDTADEAVDLDEQRQ